MATRDLSYLIDFNVEGAEELSTAATNMETLAEATTGVSDTATLELDLPPTDDITAVGDALGDLGADGGPVDQASEKTGGLSGAFNQMVGAISLVQVGAAGVDFLMGQVNERLDAIAETDAWEAGRVQAYADALSGVVDDTEAVRSVLEELSSGSIVENTFGGSEEIPNFAAALGVFGINAEEVIAVIQGGQPELDAFEQRLDDVGAAGTFGSQVMGILAGEQAAYATESANSAAAATFFAESQETANASLQELLLQRDPMSQFTSEWDLLKESMADGSIDTTAAADALNTLADGLSLTTDQVLDLAQADLDEAAQGARAFADALNSIDFQNADVRGATNAFSEYTNELFAAGNEAERREAAFDALTAAAEDQTLTFAANTEAGRAQSDALEAVARVIDEDLVAAYDNANGSQEDFIAAATQIGDETLARLTSELGLSAAQAETLRVALGLTEGDYQARFDLAGEQEALVQLGLLQGAIEGLPDDIETAVTLQILAGDYVGARDTVVTYYAENPAPLPITYEFPDIQSAAQGFFSEGVAVPAPEFGRVAQEDEIDVTLFLLTDAARDSFDSFVAYVEEYLDLDTRLGVETDPAALELALFLEAPYETDVTVNALLGGAAAAMSGFVQAERTTFVDVATGDVDLPSNADLRARIGTIRVPVQAYWNTRIEGNRPT